MRKRQNEKESGAIIIEATIALTTFMFAIVSILFVAHICYAQAKIGTVIDGVAKDLRLSCKCAGNREALLLSSGHICCALLDVLTKPVGHILDKIGRAGERERLPYIFVRTDGIAFAEIHVVAHASGKEHGSLCNVAELVVQCVKGIILNVDTVD